MKTFIAILLVLVSSQAFYAQTAPGKNHEIKIVTDNEPGKTFELTVKVLDIATKKPVSNAEVFVYQTNAVGDYEEDKNGIARINGTAYSNAEGAVKFYTIYPRGYNNSSTGEHMHFKIKARGYNASNPTLVFADYHKKRDEASKLRVSKVYLKKLKDAGTTLTGEAIIYIIPFIP